MRTTRHKHEKTDPIDELRDRRLPPGARDGAMILLLFRALALLPLPALHVLGAALGWLLFALVPSYRRTIRGNLPADLRQDRRVLRGAIAESGKQVLELAWVWSRPTQQILAKVRIDDPQEYDRLLRQDRAVLILTPHLGCFEMIAQSHMASPIGRTRPMLALYRVPRKAALRPLFEQARAHNGLLLAPADLGGVRLLLRALRKRQVVGMLPDQVPSRGEGVWAPFFGRPAFTMTLPARLAHEHNALVIMTFAQRLPHGAGYRIRWQCMEEGLDGDPAADAGRINRALERLIRLCPEQYLWSYKRYKVPSGATAPDPGSVS